MIGRRYHIGLSAVGNVKSLDGFANDVGGDLTFTNIEKLDAAVHTGADDGRAQTLDLWDWIFEAFDNLDGVVRVWPVVPAADWSVVAGGDLSELKVTMTLLSGLKVMELTRAVWPVYLRMNLPSMTSVRMMFLSPPPLINFELSLLMSNEYTS